MEKEKPKKKKTEKVVAKEKVVETKEKVEAKKDFAIEEKEQKRLKGISKFIYIVAKIIQVFLIIGIVGVVIAMICIPIVTSNISFSKGTEVNSIKAFGKEVEYIRTEKEITFYEKGKYEDKEVITKESDVKTLNKVFDYLERKDLSTLGLIVELELVLVIVLLFIELFIFRRVYSFFKNIHDKESPFILENVDLLKNTGKLLIYSYVVTLAIAIVTSIVLSNSASVNIEFRSIIVIVGVFALAYIFQYGCNLEKVTKGKIYKEE